MELLIIALELLMAIIIGIIIKDKNIKNSKNKYLIIRVIESVVIIALFITVSFMYDHKYDNVQIEENYFAVLNAGAGEITNRTYLYMENENIKYIQTQAITTHWGSSEWVEKVTNVGKLNSPLEVIEISKQNKSNGWVKINVDIRESQNNKTYKKGDIITIDEFIEFILVKQNK